MKAVGFRRQAAKGFRKLPQGMQNRVTAALRIYAETGKGDVKKLKNREGARLVIGSYRAIFVESAEAIDVLDVGHRRDIYR